jgi:TolB protein
MNKFRLLFLVLLLFQEMTALSGKEEDTFVIALGTEAKQLPLYLSLQEDSSFNPSYLNQLEAILRFDLDHNGRTLVQQKGVEDEALAPSLSTLKKKGIYAAIYLDIRNQQISALILSVASGLQKRSPTLDLTGDLSQDRRQIHRLADGIHQELFGTPGIASTHLLYTVKKGSQSEVWEADYDGFNARQVTHQGGYCLTPAYIPPRPGYSSSSLVYVSYQIGQPKIYAASLKNGIGHRLVNLRGNQLMPAISLQRDKVAFISDVAGHPDLFIQSFSPETGAVGKPQQVYASRHGVQGSPAFSPDGKKIAFVSNKDGSTRIYMMPIPAPGAPLKELKPRLITHQSRESSAPAWSSDGSKLAYCALTQGVRQIWIYDFKRDQEQQLTQGPGNKENPTWAPNSEHLVFNSTGAQGSDLYLIHLHQPQAVKITQGPGDKRFPNWECQQRSNQSVLDKNF